MQTMRAEGLTSQRFGGNGWGAPHGLPWGTYGWQPRVSYEGHAWDSAATFQVGTPRGRRRDIEGGTEGRRTDAQHIPRAYGHTDAQTARLQQPPRSWRGREPAQWYTASAAAAATTAATASTAQ